MRWCLRGMFVIMRLTPDPAVQPPETDGSGIAGTRERVSLRIPDYWLRRDSVRARFHSAILGRLEFGLACP